MALERLAYDGPGAPVHYRSDKRDGPTAGTQTVDPLEFLARLVTHIPNKHQVMTRYYGWYANRPRGVRRKATAADGETASIEVAEREALPLREARRRWAELLAAHLRRWWRDYRGEPGATRDSRANDPGFLPSLPCSHE